MIRFGQKWTTFAGPGNHIENSIFPGIQENFARFTVYSDKLRRFPQAFIYLEILVVISAWPDIQHAFSEIPGNN
ncbi:MAG: hypothetical protein ACLQMS_10910 [Desulfomonilaceae bacterium]